MLTTFSQKYSSPSWTTLRSKRSPSKPQQTIQSSSRVLLSCTKRQLPPRIKGWPSVPKSVMLNRQTRKVMRLRRQRANHRRTWKERSGASSWNPTR
eukprot:1019708-Amphidinium_carterae.1